MKNLLIILAAVAFGSLEAPTANTGYGSGCSRCGGWSSCCSICYSTTHCTNCCHRR